METDSQQSREEGELSDDGEIIDLTGDEPTSRKIEIVAQPFKERYPGQKAKTTGRNYSSGQAPQRSNRSYRPPVEPRRNPVSSGWYGNTRRTVLPPRTRRNSASNGNNKGRPPRENIRERRSPRPPPRTQGRNRKKPAQITPAVKSDSVNSVEDDYNELLMQYKTIQAKLDLIKKEEEQTGELLNASSIPQEQAVLSETKGPEPKQDVQSNQVEDEDDDEEYDELKLRLVALASAAKTQIKLSAEELERKQRLTYSSNKEETKEIRSSRRRRHSARQRHRSHTPVDDAAKKQREQDRRRRESHEILLLDDPNEQYERFMKLVGYTDRTPSGYVKPRREESALRDNYDQVEMEIDSGPESLEPLPVDDFVLSAPLLFDAPPPPPPPLPLGTPPSSPPPPPPDEEDIAQSEQQVAQVEEEEEEDEAQFLREQLLRSMKNKQATTESRTSGTESPILPLPIFKVAKRKPKKPVMIPRHQPVVISLHDDSSDSENEALPAMSAGLLGGLDSFLKSTRQSVEQKQTEKVEKPNVQQTGTRKKLKPSDARNKIKSTGQLENKELSAEQQIQEDQFIKERSELDVKRQQLTALVTQIGKRKVMLTTTEDRVEMLRQQLMAAEKLVAANKQYIQKLESQASEFKKTVEKKSQVVTELESKLTKAGVKIPARTQVSKRVADKRAAENSATVKAVKKPRLATSISNQGNKQPQKDITKQKTTAREKEKLRLQKLERAYAEKIRKLKEAQAAKIAKTADKTAKKKSVSQKAHEQIRRSFSHDSSSNPQPATAEKIDVDLNVDSDSDAFSTVVRRKSFIDENPHMKPEFVKDGDKKNDGAVVITDKKIKLPEGNVRSNIETLLQERTSISFSTQSPRCLKDQQTYQVDVSVIEGLFGNPHEPRENMPFKVYKSCLSHFKSYRFSSHFTGKLNVPLTSATYTNKINPKQLVCRFDLMGSCNDDKCPWQHVEHMKLSDTEVLLDYLSYNPAAVGAVNDSPPEELEKSMTDYAEHFYMAYKSKKNLEFMCEKLSKKVKDHARLTEPHNMFTEARRWRPASHQSVPAVVQPKDYVAVCPDTVQTNDSNDVIHEQDVRYFMLSSNCSDELELSVRDNPSDVNTWIKLAGRRRATQRNEAAGIDVALNVLARGLESNQNSSELWHEYLNLYSQKKNVGDYVDMCRHAVKLAPSYEIYHKFFTAATSFPLKVEICTELIDYVMKSDQDVTAETKSDRLLEALLMHAGLKIHGGQWLRAIQFVGKSLKSGLFSHLTSGDRCIAWLCYINLQEFHQLPSGLMSEGNDGLGRLSKKDSILLDWTSGKQCHSSVDGVLKYFASALKNCSESANGVEAKTRTLLPLYRNLVLFEVNVRKRFDVAVRIYKKLVTASPSVGMIWLYLAELHQENGDEKAAREVYTEGLSSAPKCIRFINAAASFESSRGNVDKALEILESCIINLFDVDTKDSAVCDPNLLYCKILNLPLPLNYTAPTLKPSVSREFLDDASVFLWSNYCMLLDIQGYHEQVTEVYETGLCSLKSADHVRVLWIKYLEHKKFELFSCEDQKPQFESYTKLVKRCLSSMPTRHAAVTNASILVTDHSFQNQVVSMYLDILPVEHHTTVFKKFIQMMPENCPLILRACQHAVQTDDYHAAKYMCNSVIYDKPHSVEFWKMAIAVNLHQKDYPEVRKLFWKAVQVLPYSAALWKDLILFEMCHGSQETVDAATARYTNLGFNFDNFIDAVAPTKS